MIKKPMDVLEQFPVRKSKKQKQAFRDEIHSYVSSLGYECKLEAGSFGSLNVVIGDPEKAKYLITAHYDTCARLPIPNLITPCNLILFLLYQIIMVVVMFIPAVLVGAVVSRFIDHRIGYMAAYICLWLTIVLMMVGPANKRNANDNTSGVVAVLEIAATLPVMLREKVCFVLFDLEEAGLIGSASYRKAHKMATEKQIILNMDCVGDGDEILLFPTKKLRKDENKMAWLRSGCRNCGDKRVSVREKGFAFYPSDQGNFPFGVGICALHKSKLGLYLGRIHTHRDTILETTNINILRACLITMIGSAAAE